MAASLSQFPGAKHSPSNQLYLMKDWNSLLGGYSCLVIGVTGTLVNVMVLVVLTSETKLSSQPTTAILVVITLLNILYNGLILPAQAVMYLERRWAVTVLSALYDISLQVSSLTRLSGAKCLPSPSTPTWEASCSLSVSWQSAGSCLCALRPGQTLSGSPHTEPSLQTHESSGLSRLSSQLPPSLGSIGVPRLWVVGEVRLHGGHRSEAILIT